MAVGPSRIFMMLATDSSRHITDPAPGHQTGSTKINSPQNGLLLLSTVYSTFDTYTFSINVDDGHKVVFFRRDLIRGLDSRTLAFRCRDPQNPLRVSDDLLRWHYHTAVIANMRGAAELSWEFDFSAGDILGEIMAGPDSAERMEVELFSRLGSGNNNSHTPADAYRYVLYVKEHFGGEVQMASCCDEYEIIDTGARYYNGKGGRGGQQPLPFH